MLGAYCLFKTEYKFIEYILKYNQPDNSTTQYINKDIVPTNINVLLKLYKNYPSFIPIFFNIWEGHSDGQLWFKNTFHYLFAILSEQIIQELITEKILMQISKIWNMIIYVSMI